MKAACFVLISLPGLWIGVALGMGWMGAKPVTAAIHESGLWALRLLLLTLTITPLRLLTGWNRLILIRRMLGLGALAYGLGHLALYAFEQKFDLARIAGEIALRFYLTIGFVSLAAMIALGVTSTDAMIRRLGAARWNRLHRLVYPLTALALFHAFLQARIDVSEALVMSGVFLALMGIRAMRGRIMIEPARLTALAIGVFAATLALEWCWYRFATGLPADRIFLASFDPALQPRPAWIALGLALLLPGAMLLAGRFRPARPAPP